MEPHREEKWAKIHERNNKGAIYLWDHLFEYELPWHLWPVSLSCFFLQADENAIACNVTVQLPQFCGMAFLKLGWHF